MTWFLLQFDVIIKQLQIFQRQADRAILLSKHQIVREITYTNNTHKIYP